MVPDPRAPDTPSALRSAPPRGSTPLPSSFAVREDESLHALDGGTVLLGGSPLHLFRISARARALLGDWRRGAPVGPGTAAGLLARRLVSAGALSPEPQGATLGPADVTVVVPVRDRPVQVERLLASLAPLACIVVDDASSDAETTKEIARRHGARFVALGTNVGPAGARNAGLAVSDRPLVAFVDSDCMPQEGWLEPLLGHFDDPMVAAVAPRIAAAGSGGGAASGHAGAFHRYEAARSPLDRGPRPGPVRPGSPVSFVPSAALVVRADVTTGPDLFDPVLRGGEDVDLVWRLVEAGWDVRYEPRSAVAHDATATISGYLRRQAFYGTTAAPLSRRHPRTLAPLQVSGWSLAVWLAVAARRPVLALAALCVPVLILAHRLRGLVLDPLAVATRIAGGGTLRSALPSVAGMARAWSPALVAGLAFRRTRRGCALALALGALSHWRTHRTALDPVRFTALHLADDVAYGAGVWVGCARVSGRSSRCSPAWRGVRRTGPPAPSAGTWPGGSRPTRAELGRTELGRTQAGPDPTGPD